MPETDLEARIAALEAEVARLKAIVEKPPEPEEPWWKTHFAGKYANDPLYDEAMRLGREYRESLRPKPRKPRKPGKV